MIFLIFVFVSCNLVYNLDAFRSPLSRCKCDRKSFHMCENLRMKPFVRSERIQQNIVRPVLMTSYFILSQGILTTLCGATYAVDQGYQTDVVVIGASGKTGHLIVKHLLRLGMRVRSGVRNTVPTIPTIESEEAAELVFVDVTKLETIENAIREAKVVIFAASASNNGGAARNVDHVGLANIAKECVRLKIPRLIVISVAGVTRPDSLIFKTTDLIGSIRPWKEKIMENKLNGELAVREIYGNAKDAKLSYVIIRPGILMDASTVGPKNIELNQGDTISGEVNREDVAQCVVAAALSSKIPRNAIFEIYQTEGTRGPLEDKFPPISGFERTGSKFDGYDSMFEGLVTTDD